MKQEISVNDGKYTVVLDGGKLSALRYNEHWQDLTGDNLIYWLSIELQEARNYFGRLTNTQVILIQQLAQMAKMDHRWVDEDNWYSCPKAPDGCSDDEQGTECNCGADNFNVKVAELLKQILETE